MPIEPGMTQGGNIESDTFVSLEVLNLTYGVVIPRLTGNPDE